jgi:hypothetical protein
VTNTTAAATGRPAAGAYANVSRQLRRDHRQQTKHADVILSKDDPLALDAVKEANLLRRVARRKGDPRSMSLQFMGICDVNGMLP